MADIDEVYSRNDLDADDFLAVRAEMEDAETTCRVLKAVARLLDKARVSPGAGARELADARVILAEVLR